MRTPVSLLLAGCLGVALVGPAHAGGDQPRRGFDRITFGSDCTRTAGHLQVRAERAGRDSTRVTMVASDMVDRTWDGGLSMDRGVTLVEERFEVRTRDGQARHTATLDVPFGRRSVAADVWDPASDEWCRTGVTYTPESIQVRSADRSLKVQRSGSGDLFVWYFDTACVAGTAWRGRVVATWPGRTVRRSLMPDDCGDEFVGMLVNLGQEKMPRSVELMVRDDTGDGWRASYAVH